MATTQKQRSERSKIGASLRRRGFDNSSYDRESKAYRVRCSQCHSMVVNGTAIHERGCPNER